MADQRPIAWWVTLVDRMIDEQFASTLDEHGVTRRQWQLLNVLVREPATIEQLDAALARFPSADGAESAAEHLTELIESAWVDATPTGYELTERGRGALDRLAAVIDAQRTLVAEGVSDEDNATTVETLERMARNLGWND
jgi:hypothetical protein